MSKITLYGVDMSPPVRAVKLTLKALDLPYKYEIVNLGVGAHLQKEFLKMNPQHTVPVLDDNGVWLWDSHAINSYLVDKYGSSDALYPKDLVKRAVVNQRLFFDACSLFTPMRNISFPFFMKKITFVPKEKVETVKNGLELLETLLGDNEYVAGNYLSIADFSCGTTVSNLRPIVKVANYPKVAAWLQRLEKLPYFHEINETASADYDKLLSGALTFEQ